MNKHIEPNRCKVSKPLDQRLIKKMYPAYLVELKSNPSLTYKRKPFNILAFLTRNIDYKASQTQDRYCLLTKPISFENVAQQCDCHYQTAVSILMPFSLVSYCMGINLHDGTFIRECREYTDLVYRLKGFEVFLERPENQKVLSLL